MGNYKLALDVAKGIGLGKTATDFSLSGDVDQMIRGAFLEEIGVEQIDFNTYRENKYKIFRILQETISPIVNDRLEETMGRFAEVRNVAWGDTTRFEIENPDLFDVAVIADGTANLRRQRLDNGYVDVAMTNYGISIYDEFYRFLAGRTNWAVMVDKVAKSYEKQIAESVYAAIYGSYDNLEAEFKYTGSYDEDELLDVLAAVEAVYGNAIVVGTKAALRKIKPEYVGGATKDAYNALGHIGVFGGYDTVALEQFFKAGTNEFALSNTDLLILPSTSEKIVKIVHEGDAIIQDKQNDSDLTIEHTFIKKAGVGLGITNRFGIVRFT